MQKGGYMMLNRFLFVFVMVFVPAVAVLAGEEIMPLAPGADWRSSPSAGAQPALRKNMVRITLPSLAARARPDDVSLEARDLGITDIPGLVSPESLTGEPFAVAANETWRHHVPEEMRFPMEPPLGVVPDGSIASNQVFNAMLDDLVDFDFPPVVPVPAPVSSDRAIDGIMPLVPPAGGTTQYRSQVTIPSLPMPSEILRNDPAHQSAYVPLPVLPVLPPPAQLSAIPEQPVAISPADFGGYGDTVSQSGIRPRRVPPGRPEPEGFTPMRNLKSAISATR